MKVDNTATLIEAWFAKYDRDGEFICSPRSHPYALIGASRGSGPMVYCPKLSSLPFCDRDVPNNVSFLGRFGLPNKEDANWMRQMVGKRQLLFLGDLDPVDLLIFAWLRWRLRAVRLTHFGINDALLMAVGFEPRDNVTIPLRGSERKALTVMTKAFPDYSKIVGESCAALLASGRKLELEALVSYSQATRDGLFSLLRVNSR